MKVVIVEDEGVAARRMQRLLEDQNLTVTKTLSSLKELRSFLDKEWRPEIFFLDIHLNDGIVFEVLNEYDVQTPIIFTTAYDQYAIKAFKQNSVDYLLKPIDNAELKAALAKYTKAQKAQLDISALSALLHSQPSQTHKKRISIRIGDKIKSIDILDIKFFYSEDKINFLYTAGRSYPIDYTIEQLSSLVDPQVFHRANRGHLVNIKHIETIIAYSNSRLKVVMSQAAQHEIIVSRDRVKGFKEWLG